MSELQWFGFVCDLREISSSMPLDADFLAILACPACRSELIQRQDERLYCAACRRSYPVRDDIPILLLDEALVEDQKQGAGTDTE